MVQRNDKIVVEICKSHVNPESNPFVGVVREGELSNMIAIFDRMDRSSKGLEVGRFASVTVLHVLPKSLIVKFESYALAPFDSLNQPLNG